MWRQKPSFPGSRDSDQSLSDDEYEEEFERVTVDNNCTEKLQSLLSAARKKEKKMKNVCEDEVKMESFQNEEHEFIQCLSRNEQKAVNVEESISDEDNAAPSNVSFTSEVTSCQNHHIRNSESERWFAIAEEANKLVYLHEKARSASSFATNSDVKRQRKDGKSKGKPKFSIHFQTLSKEHLSLNTVKDENVELYAASEETTQQNFQPKNINRSMAELLDVFKRQDATQLSTKLVDPDRNARQSIFTLLENLEERDGGLEETPKMTHNDKKIKTTGRRTSSNLGNRSLVSEQSVEHQDTRISSDDEDQDIDQYQLSLVTGEIKEKAMVDLFLEAFRTGAVDSEWSPFKQSGIGYHARLQQIMQIEKDGHAEFLKQLQTGEIPHDESRCINVQILSRLLDAKLTVCRCMLARNVEKLQYGKDLNNGSDAEVVHKTIIFRSKICDNVELEVGNVIRIYPQWRFKLAKMKKSSYAHTSPRLWHDSPAGSQQHSCSYATMIMIACHP